MEFRNIVIANAAKLSIQNDQLCIAQKQEVTIPFDDISALMIESRQVLVTSAVMERLASEGITVFFCDEKHFLRRSCWPTIHLVGRGKCCLRSFLCSSQFKNSYGS